MLFCVIIVVVYNVNRRVERVIVEIALKSGHICDVKIIISLSLWLRARSLGGAISSNIKVLRYIIQGPAWALFDIFMLKQFMSCLKFTNLPLLIIVYDVDVPLLYHVLVDSSKYLYYSLLGLKIMTGRSLIEPI